MASGISITTKSESKLCALNNLRKSFAPFVGEEPNGITEGFHNKMELISRRAYGFRNFNNYKIRVKALCA